MINPLNKQIIKQKEAPFFLQIKEHTRQGHIVHYIDIFHDFFALVRILNNNPIFINFTFIFGKNRTIKRLYRVWFKAGL